MSASSRDAAVVAWRRAILLESEQVAMPVAIRRPWAIVCGFPVSILCSLAGCVQDAPTPQLPPPMYHCSRIGAQFEQGSAQLTERWREAIKSRMLADGVCGGRPNPRRGLVVIVTGHTASGPDDVKQLGLRRAEAVADYLVDLGYAREDICTLSKGSNLPVQIGKRADPQNSRVDVTVMGSQSRPAECKRPG